MVGSRPGGDVMLTRLSPEHPAGTVELRYPGKCSLLERLIMSMAEMVDSRPERQRPREKIPGGGRRLLVRLAGEFGTKSARTRRSFLRVLAENARRALRSAGLKAHVRPEWSRLMVDTSDSAAAQTALSYVFGISSTVQVAEVGYTTLDDLVRVLTHVYGDRVAGRSFAVRPRRIAGVPFRSGDLARALGAALLPLAARVDLSHPDVEVRVTAEPGRAFAELPDTAARGPGGLPLGSGGRAVALVSGGFDSPVAAWHVMRRGVAVEVLVCDLDGCGQVDDALTVARELATRWAPGQEVRAHVVDLAPVVEALVARAPARMRQVMLKRAMYRVGSELAREVGAEALVTGESLGQVSTQTLRNLAVCETVAEQPVLRPLIGMDKSEIIERARAIGTHDASVRITEHCSIAQGEKVITWASAARIEAAELDLLGAAGDGAWVRAAVAARRVVSLPAWSPEPLPEHVVAAVPDDMVLVDVREPQEGPQVGDLRLPSSRALEWLDALDASRSYVLVCASGRRSERLARELRRRGFAAFSLAGGVSRLRSDGRPRGGRP